MRMLGSLILMGALAVSACAHAPEVEAPTTAPANDSAAPTPMAPPSAAEVTVENLLRWPLEGTAGVEKVKAGLHQVLQMKPLIAQQFSGDGPVRLADGYILAFAEIKNLSHAVSIGLEQAPCISPLYAQKLIGAVESPGTRDMHGVDYGKTYSTTYNGVEVIFRTSPQTYRCVRSIYIYRARN